MQPIGRPSWGDYFLGIAKAVAERSDCERDKVGAVVVKDRRIRGTGYNGAASGQPGCDTCPRRLSNVPSGSSYDNCVAVHAEANALLYCNREDLIGATIYITREPCYACTKLITAAGVKSVVWPTWGVPSFDNGRTDESILPHRTSVSRDVPDSQHGKDWGCGEPNCKACY